MTEYNNSHAPPSFVEFKVFKTLLTPDLRRCSPCNAAWRSSSLFTRPCLTCASLPAFNAYLLPIAT